MRSLPMQTTNFKPLQDMITGQIHARVLLAGLKLGVFDLLVTARSAEEVADAMGAHRANTHFFLDALATIGLVEKKDGLYRNGSEASQFLQKESPTYLGRFFQTGQHMCVDTLKDLEGLVKNGPVSKPENSNISSAEMWAEATRTTAGWVTGGAGLQMAEIVSGLPAFSGFGSMLDLGGGHGMFAIYFVNAHPQMTGVVFDQPAVVAVAEENIREYGLAERMSVMAGSYFKDDIGGPYDFIWASSTLNFAKHDLDPLIKKIHSALNPGGVFMAFQDGLTHERTQPDVMLGHLGHALASGEDFFFEQGEICDSMLRCGFRSVRSRTVETPMGALDLDIAFKERKA